MLTGADDAPSWLDRVRRAHPDADGELTALIEGGVGRAPPAPGSAAARPSATCGWRWGRRRTTPRTAACCRCSTRRWPAPTSRPATSRGGARPRPSPQPSGRAARSPTRSAIRGLAAFVAAADGELDRAAELARTRPIARPTSSAWQPRAGRIFAGLARLELHLERNEPSSVREVLAEVKRGQRASHRLTLQSMVALHAGQARPPAR